jgi:hypothetical protein
MVTPPEELYGLPNQPVSIGKREVVLDTRAS